MDPEDEYFNLGSYRRRISTNSATAQTWFDRGLIWTFAFNHEEAVTCFDRAIQADPGCALAYWGKAYARGPNYNKPWDSFDAQDLDASLKAAHHAAKFAASAVAADADVDRTTTTTTTTTPVERALVDAIQTRYPSETLPENNKGKSAEVSFSAWNSAYAAKMRIAYTKYPHDLDVAALYADALMNLHPWKLWDLRSGQPNRASRTLEIKQVLDRAIAQDAGGGGLVHPGILHLYIHLMEMSPTPESALRVADHLRGLVPDAGHLNHMPSHLDVLCGDYRQAIMSNTQAIVADDKYFAALTTTATTTTTTTTKDSSRLRFYTLYRAHNLHFRLYAAMFAGQSAVALETARQLEDSIPEELLRVGSPPMADWLEGFLGMRVHALIRFGRWEDILALEKAPAAAAADQALYCVSTTMLHYARGVANAALGKLEDAQRERDLFKDALARVPLSRTIFNNTCVHILRVAEEMLHGEIEYRKGNVEQSFAHFRAAIDADQALPYDEPWGWMQPPRHAYGALLMEQRRLEEALHVYMTDLGLNDVLPRAMQHPNNVWSLHGLYECLTALGRDGEAAMLKKQLDLAVAVADVPIEASCFCRLDRQGQCH